MATFTFGASSSTRAGADPSQTQIDLLRAQLDVALARVPELETIHEMDEKLIKVGNVPTTRVLTDACFRSGKRNAIFCGSNLQQKPRNARQR